MATSAYYLKRAWDKKYTGDIFLSGLDIHFKNRCNYLYHYGIYGCDFFFTDIIMVIKALAADLVRTGFMRVRFHPPALL